ncbi:MAG: hypothetical protein LW838_07840 [Nitrosomonadaceae bacterium]|jgi:adenine-specific DNA-methyltransferase|nr:hypothetical protein [Nitrosomonadaceae bacterium]
MPTLNWLNRDAAFKKAKEIPFRLLEEVSEHHPKTNIADGNPDSETSTQVSLDLPDADNGGNVVATKDNLLIQGDNLDALKALLPFYRGQVKCIFIDPPYNTGSAFEHYDDNLEHAQWLSLMLPRLQLLRELLRSDGFICAHIDDSEGHYLKVMMDEVFERSPVGRSNSPTLGHFKFPHLAERLAA